MRILREYSGVSAMLNVRVPDDTADELDNSYQRVGGDLKAKVWESGDGERRLYLRVRDSEDRRKFNEFSVDLSKQRDTDNAGAE